MAAQKVLIVEDDAAGAKDLDSRLTGLGYEIVAIAASGREAIALAARSGPQLVVIDVALGGDMDGVDTGREIRRREQIPVLFTVDETDDAGLRRIQASQRGGYVLRPFAERELRVGLSLALDPAGAESAANELEGPFFDVSIDLVCCLGFDGHFKRLNPAWERTLGFTRAELMSRPFIVFVHPDDRERTLAQNREVRGGGQALSFENRYRCRDGSYRWLLWNAAPDSSRKTIYSVARDVTEKKRTEEERERLVHQLQAALAEVQSLRAILPICSYCKKVRDDDDYWHTVEGYLSRHTGTRFSHGVCPTCLEEIVEPQLDELDRGGEI